MENNSNKEPAPSRGILEDFFRYLRHPVYGIPEVKTGVFTKFIQIFKLWSFVIVVVFFIGIISSAIIKYLGMEEAGNAVVDLFLEEPLPVFLFLAVVWAPVTEEFTFRLGLKYSPYRLSFAAAFLFALVLIAAADVVWGSVSSVLPGAVAEAAEGKGLYLYATFIVLVGLLLGRLFKKNLDEGRIRSFYARHFIKLFYISAFAFASLHFFNFYGEEGLWILLPMLILPQMVFGLLLGYIRMRYSMTWAVVGHCLHNSIISLPLIFISLFPDPSRVLSEREMVDPAELPPETAELLSLVSLLFLAVFLLMIFSFFSVVLEYKKRKGEEG